MKKNQIYALGLFLFVLVITIGWGFYRQNPIGENVQQNNTSNTTNTTATTSSSSSDVSVAELTVPLQVENKIIGKLDNGNGTYTVNYRYRIKNKYKVNARLNRIDNYFQQNGTRTTTAKVTKLSSTTVATNPNFNGQTNTLINIGEFTILAGQTIQINLNMVFKYKQGDSRINSVLKANGLVNTETDVSVHDKWPWPSSTKTRTSTTTSTSSTTSSAESPTELPTSSSSQSSTTSINTTTVTSSSTSTSSTGVEEVEWNANGQASSFFYVGQKNTVSTTFYGK